MDEKTLNDRVIDDEVRAEGYLRLCGVDEVGCGPLAGPVYAATVIFRPDDVPEGLRDSKKLSEKKRDALYPVICEHALAYAVAYATVEEIDELNILQARLLAMSRAIAALAVAPDIVLVDGNKLPPGLTLPARAVVHGDDLSKSISAASILAKVSRDRVLKELDPLYPQYGFAKHKGYGTAEHLAALRQYGPCPIHRKSFKYG